MTSSASQRSVLPYVYINGMGDETDGQNILGSCQIAGQGSYSEGAGQAVKKWRELNLRKFSKAKFCLWDPMQQNSPAKN